MADYSIQVRNNKRQTVTSRVSESVRRVLQSISAYALGPSLLPSLDDEAVEQTRRAFGGQLALPVQSRTRWQQTDVEIAEIVSDQGDMSVAGQLMRSAQKDAAIKGAMDVRCGGLVRLPKRFRGRPDMVDVLQAGGAEARSVFDEMCPPAELEQLDRDGIELGVAVGELSDVPGRAHPVLSRLPPEHLRYLWFENRWYYQSIAGRLPITPGDGRWVLHVPGGRVYPWQNGIWRALARCYVTKEHARLHRENWEATLANPARIVSSPLGAKELARNNAFQKLKAWGVNAIFGLPVGWELKILESNGRGADSFKETIREQNDEIVTLVSGQTVTTTGGSGFANADIHRSIRADLIKRDAGALEFTINTQILPAWVLATFGEVAPEDVPTVGWDVNPPQDQKAQAEAMKAVSEMIDALSASMRAQGKVLDVDALIASFGVPVVSPDALASRDETASPASARSRLALVR